MDSDDDYESFSPPEESFSEPRDRFKRLKKPRAMVVPSDSSSSSPPSDSIEPVIGFPEVGSAQLEAREFATSETLNSLVDDDSNDSLRLQIESKMETEENDSLGDLPVDDEVPDRKEAKRALEFDDPDDAESDGNLSGLEKRRSSEGGLSDNKDGEKEEKMESKRKKNKRIKSDEMKSKPLASDKRKQEKERKAYLKQLHAESQRILRESSEAAFKPIPVVSKPISSVLEKIRQRKLELSKRNRNVPVTSNPFISENSTLRDDSMGFESRSRSTLHREVGLEKPVEETAYEDPGNFVGRNAVDKDASTERAGPSRSKKTHLDKLSLTETSPPIFRAPINDTEDIFSNSESQDSKDELCVDLEDSPDDEITEPSLPAMNLKFDSDPYEDSSSEEEDDDKENIDPLLHRNDNSSVPLRGAPAEAFLDDEAEEEDDGDDDLLRFKENEEEEDMEDFEELNDIIATNYSEKPVDHDRRNELHQKWLAQQDAAGTDNLLQKLKIGLKPEDDIFLDEGDEKEVSGDEEDYDHQEEAPKLSTCMSTKKAKEIITQMFVDKDDAFLSDEDEETEKLRVKQQLLIRSEQQSALISPMDDESSREVFGLIKKHNIVPDNKKKAKASSYFDSVLRGGSNTSFSKPSFRGRLSNHLPSSRKQSSGAARSFIFGRDDSNSRSSISISDDSSDTIFKETQVTRNSSATFSSSQAKFSSQYRNTTTIRSSSASLIDILKRASTQSAIPNNGDPVDLTHVLATFKVPKKPIRVDVRS
ncbi:OLC1v1017949C2 [Oldenlandia corymbosa var. corymbosa]|uniref:OLC1v1017949C2 n=1 Tax=Oldenlandia corymbosa var. corymbosa TaxID=529605 RepID=A0AAV1EAJ7_OLDCO|nr:OLC1v1017949C2 [Oldenlandia corymbosa var. corymbosa]